MYDFITDHLKALEIWHDMIHMYNQNAMKMSKKVAKMVPPPGFPAPMLSNMNRLYVSF